MKSLTLRRVGILPIAALALAGCKDASDPLPGGSPSARVGAAGKPTSITTCGTVINTAGKYRLDNDLTGCVGLGIAIRASGVTLLLDGHDISGTGPVFPSPNVGIDVGTGVVGGVGNVSIQGPGTVSGFGINIQLEHVVNSWVLGVTSTGGFWGIVANAGFVSGDGQPSTGKPDSGQRIPE